MSSLMEADAVRIMEGDDEDDEEEGKRVLSIITLHSAPFPFPQKMHFPELSHYFSAVAWCGRSNIIACATETCARDPGSDQQPAFWIPVHILDPERPTEHSIFNVTADSPNDWVQFLEWSPVSCSQALLVSNSNGRVTIWSQPIQGSSNVARTINCWSCEHEWRQEQAVIVKWVTGLSPYRFSPTASIGASGAKSLEERFLAHGPRSSVRWPNFLCICSILYSGSVQLHWRQWPSAQASSSLKWFATSKAVLGAGPSGLFSADAIITDAGSLIVAGTPVGTPSTVIVWEISPQNASPGGNQPLKYGLPVQTPLAFGPPTWPGIAPLAAYLMSWQEHAGLDIKSGQSSHVENDEKAAGPLLYCTPISNLSAYVTPADASTLTTWGSGVGGIAFDPSRGGSTLVTLICEGYFISPESPDDGPTLTGWRFQRWESSSQPVSIHPLFETGSGTYPASSLATLTSWTPVSSKVISARSLPTKPGTGNVVPTDGNAWKTAVLHRPVNPRCVSKILFSGHGGEFALSFLSGEIYVFSGSSLTPIENLIVRTGILLPPAVAFSPTSCCLASVWHSKRTDCSMLKLLCLEPASSAATQGSISGSLTWERHIADRFWWSLVSELDWWDITAFTQSAVDDGAVTVARVTAVLDADFHALPNPLHRQCYSMALDRIKCRMLEGIDAADIRALVLDMQARLLLDVLGKGIEASLINPSTLVAEPWLASSDTLSGLGADAMAVDPALVPTIQAYVDSILDLASHFLTRLRRYASFCRTLASHAVANPSAINSSRPGVNLSNGGTLAAQTGQGSMNQSSSGSNPGASGVQAWVQGAIAIAKINSSAESATSNAPSTGIAPTTPLPLTVSTAMFPGIPAVRLIGDCQFLHRLCQLLFFCLIFRKRQLPRFIPSPRPLADSTLGGTKGGGGVAPKAEDMSASSAVSRSSTGVSYVKTEDGSRGVPVTKSEEVPNSRSARVGSGNAGQGYTSEEHVAEWFLSMMQDAFPLSVLCQLEEQFGYHRVKYLFLVLVDLCKKTSSHPHPMPKSQVGISNPVVKLHYVDGQYNVTAEVVDASLGPHMQQLPRPRGAEAAGLLMRELELHPPAEEWNRKSPSFGPWSGSSQLDLESSQEEDQTPFEVWPRKRRYAERDAALGVRTTIGLGSFSGFMGSRRDVITGVWKTAQHGLWHKCLRCGRQTASLAPPLLTSVGSVAPTSSREAWWTGRWAYGCPMCGGRWARMV